MRYIGLLGLLFSSCGIFNAHFRETVYYDQDVLNRYNKDSYFFRFNNDPMDSLLQSFNEVGKIRYRLIVNNDGQVVKVLELKNTFNEVNRQRLNYEVQKLEWIPYINPELSTAIITFKRKKEFPSLSLFELRPLRAKEKEKYGLINYRQQRL